MQKAWADYFASTSTSLKSYPNSFFWIFRLKKILHYHLQLYQGNVLLRDILVLFQLYSFGMVVIGYIKILLSQ